MSIYSDLLFLQGHIADPRLAAALSTPAASSAPSIQQHRPVVGEDTRRHPMDLFKSLLYLGGLESIDSRIGEEEETFGQTYGNRIASERTFGKPASDASSKSFHRRVVAVAHNASAPLGCVAGGCG